MATISTTANRYVASCLALAMEWGDGFSNRAVMYQAGPGDVVYIPGGWWHETRSLTPSLTIRIGFAEETVAPEGCLVETESKRLFMRVERVAS